MGILKSIWAWHMRQRIIRDLSGFSRRELRDMGITEGDIHTMATA